MGEGMGGGAWGRGMGKGHGERSGELWLRPHGRSWMVTGLQVCGPLS